MKTLTVICQANSIFNLQKLRISDQLLPATSNGKYAIITLPDKKYYLCKIFLSKVLHPSFCNIDISVCGLLEPTNKNMYPLQCSLTCLDLTNLTILPLVENIKTVLVSVVFSHPLDLKKWKHKTTALGESIKNILHLFCVKSGSVVYLDKLKPLLNVKIHCLLIENIGNVNVGRVGVSTKIRIIKLISNITFEQIYTFSDNSPLLGGLEQPLDTLTEIVKAVGGIKVNSGLPVYKQVLVLGPTGCGKTALVQRVAVNCGLVLRTVVGPELSSPLPGEAEKMLSAAFDESRLLAQECSGGCILLLDQVESLCGRPGDSTESHVVRLANQLLALLESAHDTPGLVVVGTTSRPQALHPAARRPGHFDHEIHIGVSTESERVSILQVVTRRHGLQDSLCDQVARWTPGFVGADLALLASNVARHLERLGLPASHDDKDSLLTCWHTCVGLQQPTALRGQLGVVQGERGAFSQLGGVDGVKLKLLQAIQWPLSHSEAFQRLGLPQPRGVLLYGPPGCAKTSLARAVAGATNTTFLAVSAAQIYSPYVGDAERTVAELFHRARTAAPAILFIDEIDALVGCRGNREKGSQERILTAFLTEMDGVGVRLDKGTSQAGVVVVAATNRPDVLDPALTRPGRFDRLIYVGPPDVRQRLDILRTISRKMPLAEDVDLAWVADNTEFYSGADLSRLCKEAGLSALSQDMSMTEVRHRHWLSALQESRPSLTLDQINRYQSLAVSRH